jgi:hypothetical protein
MFAKKTKNENDDIMDSIEAFGDFVGSKVNRKRPWLVKGIIMGASILFLGGGIIIVKGIKKTIGRKN